MDWTPYGIAVVGPGVEVDKSCVCVYHFGAINKKFEVLVGVT